MRQKSQTRQTAADKTIKDIRRATQRPIRGRKRLSSFNIPGMAMVGSRDHRRKLPDKV